MTGRKENCYAPHMNIPAAETRIHRDCPSCGTASANAPSVKYAHPDWPMKRCTNCETIFLEWVPNYSELYDEIGWTKQHKIEEDRRLKQQPILARIDKMTRWRLGLLGEATPAGGMKGFAKLGPVLDVGCSNGKAFAELAPGYVPYGIEIESSAAAKANAIFAPRGGKVVNADGVSGLAQLPDDFFTGITLWSYLEHEARPREALEQTRRVLKADGVALVKVPNYACWNRVLLGAKWPGFRHPDHVQYFTPPTLERLAKSVGFSVKFRLYGRIPFNDNMYAILRPN
jgi:SAM-dependent methyltransferase